VDADDGFSRSMLAAPTHAGLDTAAPVEVEGPRRVSVCVGMTAVAGVIESVCFLFVPC
jgi:hypothetical protein